VLRLTWDDVNFEKRVLIKWTRKTKDGAYKPIEITINDELYETLWRRWENRKQNTWVFFNERTGDRFYKRPKLMKSLCKRAGIKPFGFHTLRHLMASLLADNPKISTKTIQHILGHSEQRTTEIYLHKLDGAIGSAMDSISGKFAPKKENPQPNPQPNIKENS
jgi:integrase